MTLATGLDAGLAALRLELPTEARRKLLAFVDLLGKWNRTYNLTAIRDPEAMLTHHLLDSLAVIPAVGRAALAGRRWADVGSGAGLPGIPLAIALPDLQLTSIEAVDKKAAFQRQAKIDLGLVNLEIEGKRVEQVPGGVFDGVISRAFAELGDFIRLAGHLLTPAGRLYAMKGAPAPEETARLPAGWRLVDSLTLDVPQLDARRQLLILEKS